MDFKKAKNVPTKDQKLNLVKVDKLIEAFNFEFSGGEESGDGSYSLNTTLDVIPTLNKKEFEHCEFKAKIQGWVLTRFPDERESITYKIKRL